MALQEYLVLDKYFDEVAPRIIVWQFTPNDFLDNDYMLDLAGGDIEIGDDRSYLINGSIKYALTLPALN